MSFGELIYNLPRETKKIIRSIETVNRKLVKAKNALVFNETAINENLLPNYTRIKTHDPAVKDKHFTREYRLKLVEHQIDEKKRLIKVLEEKLSKLNEKFEKCHIEAKVREDIESHLDLSVKNSYHANQIKTIKKLSKLYGGEIKVPETKEAYINLSSVELSDVQKELLNLGLNCHYQCKYDPLDKKAELEVLYQDILKLQKEKKVEVSPNLKDRLIGEGAKIRNRCRSKLLSRALFKAAKELRDDDRIVIRRADKSSIYVILDKQDYLEKINGILHDETKFEQIKKDPTDKLKAKVNRLITAANAVVGGVHFAKIVGEYSAGYAYGNVKTHKENNPLRPIISQIPTPTYKVAKRLNDLLQPYLPAGYSLRSVDEFLDILRTRKPSGILASIDVESLFTNVPVETTIQIILENVYNNPDVAPLPLSRHILEQLLRACTTESPFRGPDGQLYRQKEGVAMGSPLGPLFANFYMSEIEKRVLADQNLAPNIYCRYVDDVFVDVRDEDHLKQLITAMEQNSVLRFTFELSVQNRIPFLDVLVDTENNMFKTTVHRKATNTGSCLNAHSECPSRYKISVIRSFIRRAVNHCSTWSDLHTEFVRMKQILVNNGYSNTDIDTEIKKYMDRAVTEKKRDVTKKNRLTLFYRNYMSSAYKVDERVIREIIHDCVTCTNADESLNLVIYYQNKKTHNLVIRNNLSADGNKLKRSNVVYQFNCPHEDCRLHSVNYIGVTTTTLSRRLTMHLRDGSPKEHMQQSHNTTLTRTHLTENTIIIASSSNPNRLRILEALYIRERSPQINKQIASSATTLGLWGGGG